MKKFIIISMMTFLTTISFAAPQAVVFDFGGVMTGEPNKEAVVHFLRSSFALSEAEFENINLEKREAIKAGKNDEEFWLQFAEQKGITLARISHTFSGQIAALPIEIASQVGEDSVHATRPRATGMSLN
jgi:hypothetical protein